MKIFETHCHYEDEAYNEDREAAIENCRNNGVESFVNIGSSVINSKKSVDIASAHADFYAAVGIHPEYGDQCTDEAIIELRKLAQHEKVVAIGEIGLDYHWDTCPKDKQLEAFKSQLDLAYELDLPLVIHSREAAEDTLVIMREYAKRLKESGRDMHCVIHCFSYGPEVAREFAEMGCVIGVGGVVTFKNAKKLVATVEALPIEKIVVETDCPYMAPEPHRGERNSSAYIPHICEKIAEIKGMSAEEVASITYDNAVRLYKL